MTKIAAINQDRGIAPGRNKGAAVHLLAMRDAFMRQDCEVVAFDEPDDAALVTALSQSGAQQAFDLVYERYALGKSTGAQFARESKIPFVLEINSPLAEEQHRFRGKAETKSERVRDNFLFRQADCVVAVSSAVAEYARSRGARLDAIMICPNGVDTQRFNRRVDGNAIRRQYVADGTFVIGFHGRLRPWHGFGQLVLAVSNLLARNLPVHLLVVGEGEFDALTELPDENFTRVDWQPHARVPEFVAAFDALPLTYLPDAPFYYSPLKLMEAMACGVVPLVPDLGDLPGIVDHGKSGYVYHAGDLRGLVEYLTELVMHDAKRQSISRRASAFAMAHSWDSIAANVLDRVRNQRQALGHAGIGQ